MPPRATIPVKKSTVEEVPVGPALKKARTRKPRVKADVVYSQPADSGTGQHRMTQLVYAVNCLKDNKYPMNLQDLAIVSDTPLFTDPDLLQKFKAHDRVIYNSKTNLYSYRYDHSYKDEATLLAEIQRHTISSGGLSIRALKESEEAPKLIEKLEKEGEVLVTRTAKDRQMRHVFWNEIKPTEEAGGKLVDEEFRDIWKSLVVPDDTDLLKYLESEGILAQTQAAVSENAQLKAPTMQKKGKGKKKPINPKPGRVTNVHLKDKIDLTKDYVPSTSGK